MKRKASLAMRHSVVFPAYLVASAASLVLAACGGGASDAVAPDAVALGAGQSSGRTLAITPGSDVIAYWNQIATNTVNVAPAATGTPEERRPIYQLFPAMVHLRLFGDPYATMVDRLLIRLGV